MLKKENWINHVYAGNPQFNMLEEADVLTLEITNDTIDDRGSWFAWLDEEMIEGEEYSVTYDIMPDQKGYFYVVWFKDNEFLQYATVAEPGDKVQVPAGVNRMRLDFRYWNQIGKAAVKNLNIEKVIVAPPIPFPDPIDPPQPLPVTGIQWGPYYWFCEWPTTGEPIPTSPPPLPPDAEYFEIQGYKIGRDIKLEIIHPPPSAGEVEE